jgi:tripartite-type tricarboxylate transporter receptor subunit TctC
LRQSGIFLTIFALFTTIGAQAAAPAASERAVERYPEKPIRFIVPFPPGALNDYLGRMLAAKFTESWGKQMVVDNRAGGSTIIGTEMAAKSPPDGYTLLLCSVALAVNQTLFPKLPYNTNKDLAFVSMIAATPYLLVVQPSLPVKSLRDLVALAKSKPGQLNYGSTGNGGTSNLMGEMLKTMAKIDIVHIPYKGLAPALTDMMGGQINIAFGGYSTVGELWKSGRLRAIAVTSAKRSPYTPELPTIAESGYPGYEATPWWGIAVSAGTPKPIIFKLNAEIHRIMKSPDVAEQMNSRAIETWLGTPEELAAYYQKEVVRWAGVVKTSNIKSE